MNLKHQLILLFLVINFHIHLANVREANEGGNIGKYVFKNARIQTRHRTDRNYQINRKSPYICEFGSNCDDRQRLTFIGFNLDGYALDD